MKKERLNWPYLARMLVAQGKSHVVLQNVLRKRVPMQSCWQMVQRLRRLVRERGWTGAINWCWHLGFFLEARKAGGGRSPISSASGMCVRGAFSDPMPGSPGGLPTV